MSELTADEHNALTNLVERLIRERDEARAGNYRENDFTPTWVELVNFWRDSFEKAEARGFERGVREAADATEEYEIDWRVGPSENRLYIKRAILALLEPVTLQKPEA
jgi:hypothetical protein